jgi:hypothetical protein
VSTETNDNDLIVVVLSLSFNFTMRGALTVFVALAAGVAAQKSGCQKVADVKPPEDPLKLLPPGKAVFPCDFGAPVPMGKVPSGCAKYEVIVARGTSEPGPLGVIVGDPVVARVQRDMPGVKVRGYPVQVNSPGELD